MPQSRIWKAMSVVLELMLIEARDRLDLSRLHKPICFGAPEGLEANVRSQMKLLTHERALRGRVAAGDDCQHDRRTEQYSREVLLLKFHRTLLPPRIEARSLLRRPLTGTPQQGG